MQGHLGARFSNLGAGHSAAAPVPLVPARSCCCCCCLPAGRRIMVGGQLLARSCSGPVRVVCLLAGRKLALTRLNMIDRWPVLKERRSCGGNKWKLQPTRVHRWPVLSAAGCWLLLAGCTGRPAEREQSGARAPKCSRAAHPQGPRIGPRRSFSSSRSHTHTD